MRKFCDQMLHLAIMRNIRMIFSERSQEIILLNRKFVESWKGWRGEVLRHERTPRREPARVRRSRPPVSRAFRTDLRDHWFWFWWSYYRLESGKVRWNEGNIIHVGAHQDCIRFRRVVWVRNSFSDLFWWFDAERTYLSRIIRVKCDDCEVVIHRNMWWVEHPHVSSVHEKPSRMSTLAYDPLIETDGVLFPYP